MSFVVKSWVDVMFERLRFGGKSNMYRMFLKHVFDIIGATLALIFLAIPMLIIALITHLDSDGSAFFVQKRCGLQRKPFNILKFRTMSKVTPVDVPTNDLIDVRQTKWQKFLRQSSLDELPQLINVLKGDMSFIGPRPVIFEEQDLIMEREKLGANDVFPGLTGWAQVNGRDDLGYQEKAKLDAEYVSKMSFWFDIKCLCLTFFCVVRQNNIKKFD